MAVKTNHELNSVVFLRRLGHRLDGLHHARLRCSASLLLSFFVARLVAFRR